MKFAIQEHEGAHWIDLFGVFNEESETPLKELAAHLETAQKIVFKFKNVKSMRTIGVRAWVNFLHEIQIPQDRAVFFAECTPETVMQINMLPSFLGKAQILSFYVNYISPETDKTHTVLYEMKDLQAKKIPPAPNCPDTGVTMECEELEDEYFAFLLR